jgi:hypothetical protein
MSMSSFLGCKGLQAMITALTIQATQLIAIKEFTFCEITVAALHQFCVHHQITAYKNKNKEIIGALIIPYTRTKSITDALFPCSEEDGKDIDVAED